MLREHCCSWHCAADNVHVHVRRDIAVVAVAAALGTTVPFALFHALHGTLWVPAEAEWGTMDGSLSQTAGYDGSSAPQHVTACCAFAVVAAVVGAPHARDPDASAWDETDGRSSSGGLPVHFAFGEPFVAEGKWPDVGPFELPEHAEPLADDSCAVHVASAAVLDVAEGLHWPSSLRMAVVECSWRSYWASHCHSHPLLHWDGTLGMNYAIELATTPWKSLWPRVQLK